MAESTDKRTRQIADKRVDKGQEFERYQEAQNQLLAIQAEQQQNLAIQKAEAQNVMEQNQLLGQAAEIMAMDDLNSQTQQVLSGYGLNQPKVIKNSDIKRQGPNNITINNTTINNTAGPVQGREVSIRPQEAQQGRFKAWLTNVFARQDALFQKQNQEYIRRENSLTRNANKMLRKLDNIGKDIGKALDPRRIANTEKNRIKTLATIIGIPLLIKYLPKLFDGLNNFGEKIKNVFTGEDGIFSKLKDGMSSEGGWLKRLIGEFWTPDGKGILNEWLRDIEEGLFKRSELAKRYVDSNKFDNIGDKILSWLGIFFGGTDAAVKIAKGGVEKEIREGLDDKMDEVNSNLKKEKETMASSGVGGRLFLREGSRFGISSTNGKQFDQQEYKAWLKKNNLTASEINAKKYLNEQGFAYTGEAIILTQRIYEDRNNRAFNPEIDLDITKTHLRIDSYYPDLSTSLELINEIARGFGPRGKVNGVPAANLQYLFSLLMKKAENPAVGSVIVFPELIKLLTKQEIENQLELKKVKVKLIRMKFQLMEEQIYWKKGTQGLSDYYKKIVKLDDNKFSDKKLNTTPIVLKERDFTGKENQSTWEFIEITSEQLGTILEGLTGNKELLYDTSSQERFSAGINDAVHSRGRATNRNIGLSLKEYEPYESALSAREEYRSEREARKEQKRLEKEAKKTAKWSRESSEDYMSSKKSRIARGIEDVNYSPNSSSFSVHPTQENLDAAPKVKGGIRNVTQAFGGSGTLTSNFMEYRKDYYYKNGKRRPDGYHYGVDLANNAHDDVLFPGNGTVDSIVTGNGSNNRIDIKDDNGYITRYYHTRAYGGLKVGDRISPGQPIGVTQSRSENGNAFGPHIHVEVHDPEWTPTNKHSHYVNPLVYWDTNKAEIVQTAAPEYLQRRESQGSSNTPTYNPDGTVSASNYLGAQGEFSGGPSVTPNIERHSPAYTPSSTAVAQKKAEQMTKGGVTSEDKQVLLSALGIIADNTAETAHILRNTDRNVAGIGGAVSKPAPQQNPSVPSVQTKNP